MYIRCTKEKEKNMKKIEWSKNSQVGKLEDNNTPFMEIDIKLNNINANARLYWTSRGTYGCQVQTVLRMNGEAFGDKTTGCGYSKKGHALNSLFDYLKISPPNWSSGSDNLHYYHIGGNYYMIVM